MNSTASTFKENKKILLVLLPYWTGLIPPLGISCLKSYLRGHGYEVKTADANIERRFRDIYATYFAELKQMIPPKKQGNFYNIGNDVLRNHMMAHMNRSSAGVGNRQACEEKGAYTEVVKELVFRTFFTAVSAGQVERLDTLIADFYNALETYMAELLDTEQPDVLGVSVYNGTLPASMYAFRMAKQRRPRMLTVMGGGVFADQLSPGPSHAAGSACDVGSPNFDAFLDAAPYIDKIIVGEGEQMFLKLLRGELPEDQRVFRLQDIGFELLNLETVD
ncbi:MAG: hypothetical protein GY765_37815, partial [bacterium]|nr:hypothetical protein [bacterium]